LYLYLKYFQQVFYPTLVITDSCFQNIGVNELTFLGQTGQLYSENSMIVTSTLLTVMAGR